MGRFVGKVEAKLALPVETKHRDHAGNTVRD